MSSICCSDKLSDTFPLVMHGASVVSALSSRHVLFLFWLVATQTLSYCPTAREPPTLLSLLLAAFSSLFSYQCPLPFDSCHPKKQQGRERMPSKASQSVHTSECEAGVTRCVSIDLWGQHRGAPMGSGAGSPHITPLLSSGEQNHPGEGQQPG